MCECLPYVLYDTLTLRSQCILRLQGESSQEAVHTTGCLLYVARGLLTSLLRRCRCRRRRCRDPVTALPEPDLAVGLLQ